MQFLKLKDKKNVSTTQISHLERQLDLQKKVSDITNKIHAAKNIKQIIVDMKDAILQLFDAEVMSIYVADAKKDEIFSLIAAGSRLTEIRVPINNHSIAGYVANTKKTVNIADAYNTEELQKIDSELRFDVRWDQKSGIRTKQILAVPILWSSSLMGVAQIVNKKSGEFFTAADRASLLEIAQILGIAFYNQTRIRQKKKSRFDYLIRHGIISDEDLENAWSAARDKRLTIEDYLMKERNIKKQAIGNALAEFYGVPFVEFNDKYPVPFDLLANLKEEYLRRELWIPLEWKENDVIRVLIDDPNNILKRDMIESLLDTRAVEYNVALYNDIKKYINHFYQKENTTDSISDIIGQLDSDEESPENEEEGSAFTESDSIIMQLVNRVINDAYNRKASDIHVEPNTAKKNVEIRYRVDGDLMVYQTVPYNYRSAIISRIKIMANLDITERRLPQDGKIKFRRSRGVPIELRVATVPTQGGVEDVVMRILTTGETMPLEETGLSRRNHETMIDLITKPYGLALVVGPTGSGKTTTLHAALKHINSPEKKIWTAEDPVEITQYGLRQVQVNPKIRFDFATAMRSFLRADPDVIMVGEMRDYETAKTGIEASLTGHLVFSTLHTNSAPETIVRLLDMGIDPLNFADSLLGILAQRLVRTLCPNCKEAYHPEQTEYDEIITYYGSDMSDELNVHYDDNFTLYRPKGCAKCGNSGYRGRMGIQELLVSSDTIKHLIQQHATVEEMRDAAVKDGMRTLLQDGIQKVLSGKTDFHQVRRVCIR